MREYTVVLNECFARGLRPTPRNPRNEEYLAFLRGAIPYDNVLSSLPELPEAVLLPDESWPFPQLFELRIMRILCGRTSIYSLASPPVLLVDGLAPGSTWSVADFGEFVVLTNGVALVTRDPFTGSFGEYADCKIPPCICVCNLNEQLLVGGVGGL